MMKQILQHVVLLSSYSKFLEKLPDFVVLNTLQEAGILFGPNSIPINHIIATEYITTQSIMSMIELPGINEIGSFCDSRIIVASTKVELGGKLLGKSISSFSSYDGKASVLAVYRDKKYLSDLKKEAFQIGDEVFFCCERDRALSQLSALRKTKYWR